MSIVWGAEWKLNGFTPMARRRCVRVGLGMGSFLLSILLLIAGSVHWAWPMETFDGKTETFSLSKASKVIPPGTLQIIEFFPWGGGGDEPIEVFSKEPFPATPEAKGFEPLETVTICPGSGWKADRMWLVSPDGGEHEWTKRNGNCQTFIVPLDGPFGTYAVGMESNRQTYWHKFQVVPPDGPRTKMTPEGVVLFNFRPKEPVRLTIYRLEQGEQTLLRFQLWQEFVVGDDGHLLVRLPPELARDEYLGIATGHLSGEASHPGKRSTTSSNRAGH